MALTSEREKYAVTNLGVGMPSWGGGFEMLPGDQAALVGLFYGFWAQLKQFIGRYANALGANMVRIGREFVTRPLDS